jgi:hypothetical protein
MISDLSDLYKPPVGFDDVSKIKLKLIEQDKIFIEGNRKFRMKDSGKPFGFYDTVYIKFPGESQEFLNKYFFLFENFQSFDSVYIVVAKSEENNKYWKQVFFSSVHIEELNDFNYSEDFRIENKYLVNANILENNDSLIQLAYKYYNENLKEIGINDCGTNCDNFMKICNLYSIPVRIVTLQGGDDRVDGYQYDLGYPLHRVCEIYSSKLKKWFVLDPTYGFIYTYKNEPLNAIEISNRVFFNREILLSQDSVLITKRSVVNRDYFKYYENVFFFSNYKSHKFTDIPIQNLYGKFMPFYNHYSNKIYLSNNAYIYLGLKTVLYIFILFIYVNVILYQFYRRLLFVKMSHKNAIISKNILSAFKSDKDKVI